MRSSTCAKQFGISYEAPSRRFRDGKLNAYRLSTGRVIATEDPSKEAKMSVAVCRRVLSSENKEGVRQLSSAESGTTHPA
ncbi:MAG: hypothetical protein ACLPX5_12390 [Dissulfurispiraceae bacterium]